MTRTQKAAEINDAVFSCGSARPSQTINRATGTMTKNKAYCLIKLFLKVFVSVNVSTEPGFSSLRNAGCSDGCSADTFPWMGEEAASPNKSGRFCRRSSTITGKPLTCVETLTDFPAFETNSRFLFIGFDLTLA